MRSYWVFSIGTGEYSPPEDWMAHPNWRHHTSEMWFPPTKKPSGVRAGDRAVMRGSLAVGFFAVVEVESREPEKNQSPAADENDRARWKWLLHHRLLVAIRADELSPSLEDVGWDNPRRFRRQPHVRIDEATYRRITKAIIKAGEAGVT